MSTSNPSVSPAPDASTSIAAVHDSAAASTTSIAAIAREAIAALDALEAKLGLNIVVPPNDKAQMRALTRVTPRALGLASEIVTATPSRFPDFVRIQTSAAYVEAMTPLAARAALLAAHVQKSVQNERAPASQMTLALYGVVKSLGRIVENETMREKVVALRAEVAPPRKGARPKQTKAEKAAKDSARAKAKRAAKAAARAATREAAGSVAVASSRTPSPPP